MASTSERVERAIAEVESAASSARSEAEVRWRRATTPSEPILIVDAAARIRSVGRLTVNFHPDRLARSGLDVAGGLAMTGRYRSQWVTGISNGGRSARPGGDRQRWEQKLFGDAYADADPDVDEFPIYGAFDLLSDAHGGSPRFGSSYLVLRREVLTRTTMCVGDSHADSSDVGTVDEVCTLLAGLAEQAADGRLLDRPLGPSRLTEVLRGGTVDPGPARSLDGYVEAQIHGGIELAGDVDAIVVDPSFRGTSVSRNLMVAAERYDVELRWHAGSELDVDDVPDDFRGSSMPALAARVARPDGVVDARAIGAAAASVEHGPIRPTGDAPDTPAQQLKYLWHTLLAFGCDAGG